MENDVLHQLYTLTKITWAYFINPIVDGLVSWWSIQSTSEYSEVTFENWQQGRYEKISRHCTTIKVTRWNGKSIIEHHIYDVISSLRIFLVVLQDKFEEEQRILVLDILLKSSPSRWCSMHKEALTSWDNIKLTLQYRFILPSQVNQLHNDQKLNPQLLTLELYDG